MLKYFYEPGGHPIIELCGEHGTAKTTTERIVSRLVDPSAASARSPPADERDLTAAAHGSYVLAYDNLSSLPPWLSDALCRLATGAGLSGRTLFTNTDETIVDAKRPLILTGINPIALRGDIADRTNKIFLQPIEQGSRKDELSLWREFEIALPKLVGAIMDALATGLKNLPKTKPANLPRMADYAIWGTACELAYTEPGNLMRALGLARTESVEDVLEASVVAQVLRGHLQTKVFGTEWKTTAGAMYAALKATATEMEVAKSDRWPSDGQRLLRELMNVAPALREVGIEIRRGNRQRGNRPLIITHPGMGKTASPASTASPDTDFNDLDGAAEDAPASPSVTPNPLRNNGSDADDTSDTEIPTQGCQGDDGLEIPAGFLGQPPGRTCAQCRLGDGELEPKRDGDRLVWLHRECRRFWAKEHAATRNTRVPGGGFGFKRAPRQQPVEFPGDGSKNGKSSHSHAGLDVWTDRKAQNGGQGHFDQKIAPPGDLYADLDIPPFCHRCKQCNGIGGVNLVSLPGRTVQLHPACEAAWLEANQ